MSRETLTDHALDTEARSRLQALRSTDAVVTPEQDLSPSSAARALSHPESAGAANESRRSHLALRLQSAAGNAATGAIMRRASGGATALRDVGQSVAAAHQEESQDGAYPVSTEIGAQIDAQRGAGSPLDPDTRTGMESAFGRSLDQVRVHAGAEAGALSQAVAADAFTSGQDIFFGPGTYTPESDHGRALLAHEITHVLADRAGARAGAVSRQQRQQQRGGAPAAAAAPAAVVTDNPTFSDARDYVRTFFSRQRDIGNLLIEMRDSAYQLFNVYSSEQYNHEDSLGAALFSAALAAIPAAGALLATFRAVGTAVNFTVVISERLQRVGAAVQAVGERTGQLQAAGTAIAGVGTAAGAPEGRGRGEFQAGVISSLADLRVSTLEARWREEDSIISVLESHRHDGPATNLVQVIGESLGAIPTGNLQTSMHMARNRFELLLYKRFYVDSGRAYRWIRRNQIDEEYGRGIAEMPDGIIERIDALNGWGIVEADHPMRTVIRRFSSSARWL